MTAKLKKPRPSLSKKKKSPSISRSFPEAPKTTSGSSWSKHLQRFYQWSALERNIAIVCILLGIALAGQAFALYHAQQAYEKKLAERVRAKEEQERWSKITESYPLYRDGYFMVAVVAYRLGDKELASRQIEKVLEIDPNYEPGRELLRILKE